MSIKVRTNISNEFDEIEVIINSPEKNKQVAEIEEKVLNITQGNIETIIGQKGNDIFVINVSDIIMFYSEDKNNYCKTSDGVFLIKEKLYFLEENLSNNQFIRISNSAIINIDKVECFNMSFVGSIIVKLKDGSEEYVSKRKISSVMKFLKERRGYKNEK